MISEELNKKKKKKSSSSSSATLPTTNSKWTAFGLMAHF